MDKISEERIARLHPKIRDEVTHILGTLSLSSGTQVRVTQTLRTFEEQDVLYAQGRTKKGSKVTNAKGGQSIHNYGLAFDFVLLKDGKVSWNVDDDWRKVAQAFIEQGYTWGGNWTSLKDYPHLEKTFGETWQSLLDKYTKDDFIPGTKYVKI